MRKEGEGSGAVALWRTRIFTVLLSACIAVCAYEAGPAFAGEESPSDAESINRLSYYFEDSVPISSVAEASFTDHQVYYSNGIWGNGQLPDRLEASGARVSPEGLVEANEGTLYISSFIEGEILLAQAADIRFDTQTGEAELAGNVTLELLGTELRLECGELYYDPLMEQLEAEGVTLNVPTEWFLQDDQLGEQELRANFGDDIYTPLPENIRLTAGLARLKFDAQRNEFVLFDVTLSHHPRPDPDLFIHADTLRMTNDDHVILEGFSVNMSGVELFSWPRVSRNLRGGDRMISLSFPIVRFEKDGDRMISLSFPIVRFEKDVGFAWKQGVRFDFDFANAELMLDYAADYGLLSNGFAYIEPIPGSVLGIEAGTRSVFDINRVSVERRADYNLVYRQKTAFDNDWLRDLVFSVEYGNMVAFTPAQLDEGIPEERNEDTRLFGDGWVEFPLVRLGDGLYLTTGAVGRYVEYEDAGQDYRVAGGFGGVIYRLDGFDHFVLYRANRTSGQPLFSFDEVRQREVDFMTSLRLHPEWRHVIRGIYDIEEGEFNQLKVSALKKQKTYEIGMFWDFARESAGLELGLLVD